MEQLSEVLKNTCATAMQTAGTQNTSQHGSISGDGRTIIPTIQPLPTSQASLDSPQETGQRAMNAVLWLASPERKTLTTGTKYEMLYDPVTGLDDWLPCRPVVNFDRSTLPEAAADRFLAMLELASLREINYHINRLLLHRRKGGLGELSLPQFVDDVAGMIRRESATSLGVALLVDYLIRYARNTWFPEWSEISEAVGQIEPALLKIRRELTGEVLPEIEDSSHKARAAVAEKVDLTEANEKWERDMARLARLGYTLGSVKRGMSIEEFCDKVESAKA